MIKSFLGSSSISDILSIVFFESEHINNLGYLSIQCSMANNVGNISASEYHVVIFFVLHD